MSARSSLSVTLDGAVVMDIEVQPLSSVQGITGFNPWRSRISLAVKAAAKQGQANQAVLHVLAAQLDLLSTSLSVASGHRSRLKSVRIEGAPVDELAARLDRLLEDPA
ncbi:MAG: DUF167 domain-containing protein [Candidatus Thermoplasmatota archaeon]